jgi:hypothetical protein
MLHKTEAKPKALKPRSYEKIEVSGSLSYVVRKSGPSDSLREVKFLLSKIVHEPQSFVTEDLFVFQTMIDRLLETNIVSFRERHFRNLVKIAELFPLINNYVKTGKPNSTILRNSIEFQGIEIFGAHAYFGLRNQTYQRKWLVRRNAQLCKKNRPQRFVGVGYRDHGTCSVPATDGSPPWQVVASSALVRSETQERESEKVPFWYLQTYSSYLKKVVSLPTRTRST